MLFKTLLSRRKALPAVAPSFTDELARRLAGPQRHRLLQGFPAMPLMEHLPFAHEHTAPPAESLTLDPSRGLIVGVLPHPFCNPQVRGCGFCTFPQQPYNAARAARLVETVAQEVRTRTRAAEGLRGRAVEALYFGGATANLTPWESFELLTRTLAGTFDLTGAELTLEGVPAYFLGKRAALLDVLADTPARQRRLSMGVQSFDAGWRQRMGRAAFGGPAEIAEVVTAAHARGWTTSCDLLINLPGQAPEAMVADVSTAIALGFDQVCVYHLVLHEGLGTEWSQDPALLAARPDNAAAFASWSRVREHLLASGFAQTTLTNFERAEVNASERRFRYEDCSFRPERYDGLGFGPSGITLLSRADGRGATKLVNATEADRYTSRVDTQEAGFDRRFRYEPEDVRLLHVTRTLARLALDRDVYRARFGTDVVADHTPAIEALVAERLVDVDDAAVRLTPRGMFHADAVAGLVAWPRTAILRKRPGLAQGRPWRREPESFMG